jgi:hypothetical protein
MNNNVYIYIYIFIKYNKFFYICIFFKLKWILLQIEQKLFQKLNFIHIIEYIIWLMLYLPLNSLHN